MADAGIGEAAILAAAAEASAAGAATAGTVAATLPEVVAAAAPVVAGTAAETAATAVPALALAAPEVAAPIAAAATEVPAVSGGLLGGAETAVPAVTTASTEAPISLLATQSEPVSAGLLGQGAAEYPLPGAAADFAASPATDAFAVPAAGETPYTSVVDTGPWDQAPRGLLEKLGNWWDTSSVGDKLSAGGKVLGGVSAASKAATGTQGTSAGPKTTIRPGVTGKPQGGEQALAAVVEALLKRRDAYTGAQYGTPVAYRPRGLLG